MKILIIYASAGAGHLKAAQALDQAVGRYSPYQSVCVDALDYTSPLFKTLYRSSYAFLVSRLPLIWKWAFILLDISAIQGVVRIFRRYYNRVNAAKLYRFLQKEQFDYIFSTQFLSTEVAATMKRCGRISSKLITVVTDFDVHRIWLAQEVDTYAVASEWTAMKLKRLGVSEEKIVVTGIPTDERFSETRDKRGFYRRRLGFKENIFTVLIATGSFGMGPIEEIVKRLSGFQVIVVCGRNKRLFQRLNQYSSETLKVFGLVENMPELMAAADVMVTKPGGLSISEALVSRLPMIFFSAIPGQEENNIKVLKKYGIGISNGSLDEIVRELEKMRDHGDVFRSAVQRVQKLARPLAARAVISLVREC